MLREPNYSEKLDKKIDKYPTLAAPADSPHKVTRSGSPPNCSILSLTHSRANRWSNNPKLPNIKMVCEATLQRDTP